MNFASPLWPTLAVPWQCAIEEAWRAYCAGSIAIGAVITDATGKVIISGRNEVVDETGVYHPLRHAEFAVLNAFDYQQYDPPFDYCLYTTLEPCPFCMGAFYMSGLRELHYAARDPHAGSTNLLGTTPYMQRKPIRVYHPTSPLLEIMLSAITLAPLMGGGATSAHPVLEKYDEQMPTAVQFATVLAETYLLETLRQQRVTAEMVINQLEKELTHDNHSG